MSQFSPADFARQRQSAVVDVESVTERTLEALAELETLSDLPTADHVAVFESVQQSLADTLSAVDEA